MRPILRCIFPLLAVAGWVALAEADATEPEAALAAHPVTTEQAVLQAVWLNHPSSQALELRVKAAQTAAMRNAGLPEPRLDASAMEIDLPPSKQPRISLTISQPFPLGHQDQAMVHAGRVAAQAIAAQHPNLQAETEFSARMAFIAWREVAARKQVLAHHAHMGDQLLELAQRSVANGRAGQQSRLWRMQANVAELNANLEALQTLEPALQASVQALMGQATQTELPAPDLRLPEGPLEVNPANLLTDHPTLARRNLQAEAAKAQAKAESAANAGVLMPGVGVMSMADMPFGLVLMVGATLPGWGASKERAAARAGMGVHQALALEAETQAWSRGWLAQMHEVSGRLRSLTARRDRLANTVMPLLRKAAQADTPGLVTGNTTVFDIYEALHQQVQLELNLVDLDTAWLQARAQYLRLERGDGSGAMATGTSLSLPASSATGGMGM